MFGSIAGAESVLLAFNDDVRDHRGDGRGAARHGAGVRGQGRRQPDGHDPGLRCGVAPTRRDATRAPTRLPRGVRGGARDDASGLKTPDLGGHAAHHRVHHRGGQSGRDQDRGLVLAGLGGMRPDVWTAHPRASPALTRSSTARTPRAYRPVPSRRARLAVRRRRARMADLRAAAGRGRRASQRGPAGTNSI